MTERRPEGGDDGPAGESGRESSTPELGLDSFGTLGEHLLGWIEDYLERIEDRPVSADRSPGEIAARFRDPLPREGASAEALLDELEDSLFPDLCNVNHPGYMGLISPSPTPVGMIGDFLASAINQNPGVYSIGPAAVEIERQVVRWLCGLVGYGDGAGGHLTSGGTMSLFEAMKLARDRVTGGRAAARGIEGRLAVYVSEERHVAVEKAVDAVGIGRDFLRVVPTDDGFRIRTDALREALREDRAEGIRPAALVGVAGSTNTGAIDPLEELAAIADEHALWLHVDAAYGGGVLLSDEHRHRLDGLERADSVTVDPHKWFFAPLGAGGLLVKDPSRLGASYGIEPAYLRGREATDGFDFYVRSFEQSRRFRALKIWLSLKFYGADRFGRWIDRNIGLARRLHERCSEVDDFRTAREPRLSVVCLRYEPAAEDVPGDGDLDDLHATVADRIQRGGRFWISTTVLDGETWLRVNPVNIRTRQEHVDALFEELQRRFRSEHPSSARDR